VPVQARWIAVGFVAALALLLPAWHVVTALLSDSYMTLYAGRWVAAHGIPHHEVFTVAAHGRAWVGQQWLAELIDYEAWRVGGYGALGLLNGMLIAGAYAAVASCIARRRASTVVTIACGLVALLAALPAMFIRAQNFALPLFALMIVVCLGDAEREKPVKYRLLLLVPLLVLWANLHGSVLLGAALATAYLLYRAGQAARRHDRATAGFCALLALATAAAPLATPYGAHIITYYRDLIGNAAVAAAAPENRPPSLSQATTLLFLIPLVLAALSLIVAVIKRLRIDVPLLAAVVLTAAATLYASRNGVWLAMTAAIFAGRTAAAYLTTRPPTPRFITGLTISAAVAAAAGVALLLSPPRGGYERFTPRNEIAAVARYAAAHPRALILGDNAAASALLWHDPRLDGRIGYDARLEQYPAPSLERWIAYQAADRADWSAISERYELLIGSTAYNPQLVRRLATGSRRSVLSRDANGIAVVNHR
jgi:hypothetical protein